jgi:hypothetical protein
MQNAVQVYWAQVRLALGQITTQTAFITSVDLPERGVTPGATCEVSAETAARRIAERSHRLSSQAEIDKFHKDQAARDRECRILTEKQKNNSILALTPELATQLGFLAPAVEQEKSRGARGAAKPTEAAV